MNHRNNPYQAFGLHPLVAFGVIAVDLMLFGGEATTGGVSWVVSVAVALALSLPVVLLQRFAYKDDWGTAVGKAAILAVLTAIPTPIPALFPAAAGLIGMLKRPASPPELSAANVITVSAPPDRPEEASLDSELSRVLDKHHLGGSGAT